MTPGGRRGLPAITDLETFRRRPEDMLLDQTIGLLCAMREARALARDYGGNAERFGMLANSQAGAAALRVALAPATAWPEADCRPGVDHTPTELIGLAGDYVGIE